MKRRSSGSGEGADPANDEAEFQELALKAKRRRSGFWAHIRFLPLGVLFAAIGIVLYWFVGGVDPMTTVPYLVIAYAIGVVGLTISYSLVAAWVEKQRAGQTVQASGAEYIWFSLFYTNAFYVFLLFLGSHIVFSSLSPVTSLLLTQSLAAGVPAWMSSPSK
jgi:putative flippase GtrA